MTQGIILLLVALCGLSALAYYKFSFLSRSSNSRKLKKANQYLLDSEDYYLMKNVVFLTFDGLQKFDYLIVSRYGIFVVMVQHYYGVIEGTEYEKTWKQLERGKVKKQFANPTDVINERVETICGLLSLPKSQVFPIVLFDGISGFRNQLSNKFTFGNQNYNIYNEILYLSYLSIVQVPTILSVVPYTKIKNICTVAKFRSRKDVRPKK